MIENKNHTQVLGVIGGMGPIASAQFVLTIYNCNRHLQEQEMPEIILYSHTAIVDRSASILSGSFDKFSESLIDLLIKVENTCDKIIICCFTAHNTWDEIPLRIRPKIINLIEYSYDRLRKEENNVLLIATEGTYRSGVFLKDKPENLILLSGEDIELVHSIIYKELKHGICHIDIIIKFNELKLKYNCQKILAGCSELHLLKVSFPDDDSILDPLFEIACGLKELMSKVCFEKTIE